MVSNEENFIENEIETDNFLASEEGVLGDEIKDEDDLDPDYDNFDDYEE